jgi:hypothetical protein
MNTLVLNFIKYSFKPQLHMSFFLKCLPLVLLAVLPCAHAQTLSVQWEQEVFEQKHAVKTPANDKLIEFVRESENLQNWTKLVAYRWQAMPGASNNPSLVVKNMARLLQSKGLRFSMIENPQTGEALIDFLAGDERGLEFNVFKYKQSRDGLGVVSVQWAHRFTDTSPESTDRFLRLRTQWIQEAAGFNMDRAESALLTLP